MRSTIILIGPIGTGKSTVAALLAEKLNLPRCSMDEFRWNYYAEIGYDSEIAKQKREVEGFWGLYRYWKPFEAYAVERLLSVHRHGVIDFGAGHSVYEDDELFRRVQQVLAPYPNVVLLLPSANLEESLQILNGRTGYVPDGKPHLNEHFLRHHSNYSLAKFTVYGNGRTAEEICDEIVQRAQIEEREPT
jgi:shikimate kinase